MIVHYESPRDEAVILMRYASMCWYPTPVAAHLLESRLYQLPLTWLQRTLGTVRNR